MGTYPKIALIFYYCKNRITADAVGVAGVVQKLPW